MLRVSRRFQLIVALVCLLGGVGAGVFISLLLRAHVAPPVTGSSNTAIVGAPLTKQPAPPFTLNDQNGTPVSLTSEKGHVVLLTFLDPQCRQLCPVIGKDVGAVEQKLPAWVHPVLLIVSVAPGRTLADVNTFLAKETPGWLPGWHWLLGPNDASLKLTWLHWHISVIPTAADIEHDALLNVIDREGYLRVTYPAPLYIGDVVSDIIKIAHS